MTEAEIRAIALVRAVEATRPELIPATILVEAQLVAGDPGDARTWIARRARYLADGVLAALRPLGQHVAPRLALLGWIAPVAFVLGLSANYLGPSRKIHVVFNPIVLLVLWNAAVYVVLAVRALRRPAARRAVDVGVAGRLVERVMERVLATRLAARVTGAARDATALSRSFVASWLHMMRPVLRPAIRCVLHLAAIGAALGAVAGTYLRGLFFEYEVVWRSTFLTDPATIALALRILLAPAALLLGQPLPTTADAEAMMSAAGSPAARWIHLFAATVGLAVVVPRAALAGASALAFRRDSRDVQPDLDDPYFADLLRRAGQLDAKAVRAAIHKDVRRMCETFADEVTGFVVAALYDGHIAAAIDDFREHGGKVADFERRLHAECEAFRPALEAEIAARRRVLEERIAEQVAWRLGEVEPGDVIDGASVLGAVETASDAASMVIGDRIGGDVATGVATAVSTAVGVVAGTVSGGFGHTLGTALLVGLVESGPVGWIVGAIGGVAVAGAGFYLGHDKLRDGVKHVPLPAFAAKAALWRVDHVKRTGRERCRQTVRDALGAKLKDPMERIAEGIWKQLEPMLGERLRPLPRTGAGAS